MISAATSGEDGFSILEMIVAMTILALILGIASQSIVLASRSIAAAKAQVEAARTIRSVLADYETNAGPNGSGELRRSGWRLKASTIDVSKAKMTAILVEKTSATGAGAGEPFLTFLPAQGSIPQ